MALPVPLEANFGLSPAELTAGSYVTSRGSLDNLIKKPRKAVISIPVILIGALVFAIVLAWIETLRSLFDDAFPTLTRREDPKWVRFEGTLLRLYYAVFLTAAAGLIIYFLMRLIKMRREELNA